MIGVEPWRVNQVVSISPAAIRRAMTISAEIEPRAAAQDVGDARMAAALRFHGQVHAGARPAFEFAPHSQVRQEDHGFDIGPALPSQRILRLQEPR